MTLTACTLCRRRPLRPLRLIIGKLNILDGRGFGMTQAIHTVEIGGFDVMILTKTKISTSAYCRNQLGYEVNCLTAQPTRTGEAQGGVGIVTRERPIGWGIQSMRYYGPNVVICELVTGLTRTLLVGVYIPPSTLKHLPDLEEALKHFKDPIVFGDLNVYPASGGPPRGVRSHRSGPPLPPAP